jgi:outer membrane receptor protein involved in Fe transport
MGSWFQPARRMIMAGAALSALALAAGGAQAADTARAYDIKAEDLETALHDVAEVSGQSILAPTGLVAHRRAGPLSGRYTAEGAVRALLAGTDLNVRRAGEALVVTGPGGDGAPEAAPVAQLAEVVVTASRIRGASPAAPVQILDQTDILRSGYGDIGELARALPDAFGGGPNPGVLNGAKTASPSNINETGASTINLRGLGSDATLVLLDGHRLPYDADFPVADISAIPLAAIERVEVVTDGASALYGSDAVAGVVNFVMRSNYEGAELTERVGGATEGGDVSQSYAALGGKTWSDGHLLASLQYSHQTPILASERAFTSGAPGFNSLSQAETQTSAFIGFAQDLTPWATFRLDGLYNHRIIGGLDQLTTGSLIYDGITKAQSFLVAPNLDLSLPHDWAASLQGALAGSNDELIYDYTGVSVTVAPTNRSEDVEFDANGPLARLPSGAMKLALGAGYRSESFQETDDGAVAMHAAHDIVYAFGELYAPLVAPSDERLLLQALDLSLAGRWERYSDFGATANPRVGLRYQPAHGLILRATWGKSFKAPDFVEQGLPNSIYYYPAAALGSHSSGAALIPYGGNPDLRPERSTAWTAGLDWTPAAAPRFKASLTYFHIDFTDRVVQPITSLGTALSDPAFAPFITYNPSAAEQAAAIAQAPVFYNAVGAPYSASNVIALIQDRYENAAAQAIDGVDLSLSDVFAIGRDDRLDTVLNATWLRIVQQSAAGGPRQVITGTLFNPPKLRLRAGATWTHGPLSATGTLNYVSSETDTDLNPTAPVAAWTTADFNVTYEVGRLARWLPDLRAQLSVSNAFDAHPPYAKGASVLAPGYDFDSTNASAIGRFVALTLRERL